MPSQLQAKAIFEQLLAVQCATAKTAMQLKNAINDDSCIQEASFCDSEVLFQGLPNKENQIES